MSPVTAHSRRREASSDVTPGHPDLLAILFEEIAAQGPLTFARFMELALYHPIWGYYAGQATHDVRPRIGFEGDFYTSSDVHPALGWAISGQIEQVDRLLGSPARFTVVEVGAGKGLLARDILAACQSRFPLLFARLTYVVIDRSPAHRAHQRQTLAAWLDQSAQIVWHDDLSALPANSVTGVILSNELLDAFPVHRVQMTNGSLLEQRVTVREGRLATTAGPLSTPALSAYFDRLGLTLPENAIADVNLLADEWMRLVASRLAQGLVLTIDYGHTARDLYNTERRQGTLRSYARHRVSTSILDAVGEQDLTSHVDFTSVAAAGEAAGLSVAGFTNQLNFLMSLGIDRYCATLPDDSPELLSIAHLLRPHGMGTTFKVLLQQKRLGTTPLDGVRHSPFFDGSLECPVERSH